ncbi:GGDEF domain-containing protein [Camelimonas sp. ID_303_24]
MITATCCVAVVQGLLLLFFWARDSRPPALALTSVAFVCFGVGYALIGGRQLLGIGVGSGVGSAFMLLSGVLFISAARRLGRRRTPMGFAIAAPVVWLAAFMFWPPLESPEARSTVVSAFMAACFLLSALECWRNRGAGGGASFGPLMAVALMFSGLFTLRALFNEGLPFPLGSLPPDGNIWFGLASFGVFMLLSMVVFLVVGLTHDRLEAARAQQAIVDPVTGALRRAAFVIQGARIVARHHEDGRSACLALVGLAAPVGEVAEEALRVFARVAADVLKPTDLMARMGPNEFACLLSDVVIGEADDLTVTMLQRFERQAAAAEVPTLARAGIASSTQVGNDFRSLIQASDHALGCARFAAGKVVTWHPAIDRRITPRAQPAAGWQ